MGYIQDDVVMINHFTVRTYRTEDIDPGVRRLKILLYFRERDWSKLCTCKNNENVKDGGITAYKPNAVSDI